MANLMDLIKSQLTDSVMDQISGKLGADKKQTEVATDNILASLIEGLAKNTEQEGGADALANALEKDHDGSLLDNLHDIIDGGAVKKNPRAANGAGILKHILGGNQGNLMDMIGQLSGLGSGKTGNLMMMLAPIVLQMLGKQKRQQNLDTGGLASILANTVNNTRSTQGGPSGGLLKSLLDRDGDGSIVDDVAGMVLGRLFGRK